MKQTEAEQFLEKSVKIILTNNFHFTGKILEISDSSLILYDKFNSKVSLNLADVMICSEVQNDKKIF